MSKSCAMASGLSALMAFLSVVTTSTPTLAAENAGAAQIQVPDGPTVGQPLLAGGSATAFALTPPSGAACTGDSASDGYRVQSYMVPADVDPATLTFGNNGPLPLGSGATYRQPLYTASGGSSFVNRTTAVTTGLLTGLQAFSFAWLQGVPAGFLPAGTYNIGYACTRGAASATQLDRYWNTQITFVTDPADQPGGVTWSANADPPTTTTTTSTTIANATTSTASTSTTTSTTVLGATTSSSSSTSTTVAVSSSGVSSSSTIPSSTTRPRSTALPTTGSSTQWLVFWAVMCLVLGRIALLLGRPVRIN